MQGFWCRWRWLYGVLLLMGMLGIGGCALGRANIGQSISDERLQSIQKGVTHKTEVIKLLGPPDEISHTLTQVVFHYEYIDAKFGLFLIFSRANIKSDDLFILFNQEDIVEEVIFGRRTDQLPFQFWPFGD